MHANDELEPSRLKSSDHLVHFLAAPGGLAHVNNWLDDFIKLRLPFKNLRFAVLANPRGAHGDRVDTQPCPTLISP